MIMHGMVTLASACTLAGCTAGSGPDTALLQAQPTDSTDGELGRLISGVPELTISGERLNVELLRRFYARHGFEPVWDTMPSQVDSLVNTVLRADTHGLDPELFHAKLLQSRAALPPLDRDLLLSDAFLTYADALARGAVPVERRRNDETLTPGAVDVVATLDTATGSADPGAIIEALAPTTPTYQALRQALQKYHLSNATSTRRLHKIVVNLERERWLPRPLPADRVWVNVADERLVFYRADQPVFSTRVVVGEDAKGKQSPEFHALIDASFFNPPWVIPSDIVKAEILPEIGRNPNYLTQNNMVMLANGEAEQLPGPDAGLGLVMFDMPNQFDVYLHDTPDKHIFNHDNRRVSHGCIRVQHPRELAALLVQQPLKAIDQEIAEGGTKRHDLPAPVSVFVVYETAFADTDGILQFRTDFYNRDAEIWRQLQKRP
jgi:murein L,D-transpeptidase YcbB/YkuD